MKRIKKYKVLVLLLAAAFFFAACNNSDSRKLPNMRPRFLYHDKGPMGTNIAYRLLPTQFTNLVTPASKKMDILVSELAYLKNTAYIDIGKILVLDSEQLGQMLVYVEKGNELFISAEGFDERLLDTLHVKYAYNGFTPEGRTMKNTSLGIADTATYQKKQYGFFYYPFRNVFTGYDSSTTTVLGVNENRHVNYIVVQYGRGKIYLHTDPAAFTNYFLLTKDNTEYFKQAFSYLNPNATTVYWADTDRFGNKSNDFSALAMFWNNKMLMYALLLFCALMLLYIAFGSKRKRRLVPALPPNTNDSLSFVHTIGNLYLQKKDNRNIALKMITYFFEHVRNNYYLATTNINTDFIQSLSRKSGVEENKVRSLMEKAELVNNAESISDQELFEINNLIYEFYKK